MANIVGVYCILRMLVVFVELGRDMLALDAIETRVCFNDLVFPAVPDDDELGYKHEWAGNVCGGGLREDFFD